MDKAFDVVLQSEVDAVTVASTLRTYGEQFRYQCLCCGEEVYLAAADSTTKSPHFRHRRGNNEKDCEHYLRQQGAIERYLLIRKHNKKYVSFYFNIEQKVFEIALTLSDEEIDNESAERREFSLYTEYYAQPFFVMPINKGNLIPNFFNYYMLDKYANDYYVSYSKNEIKIKYSDVIRRNYKLNIYKINLMNSHYRKITSNVLYTNCKYLAVSENKIYIEELIRLSNIETESELFSFVTQGKNFFAVEFVISSEDYRSNSFFQEQDLRIECAENMDILWPPAYIKDDTFVIDSEKLYITSSFELIPHGNVNSDVTDIKSICENVSELIVSSSILIIEKNVECRIIREERELIDSSYEKAEYIYEDIYRIPEIYNYFLFDKNGCTSLLAGTEIFLSATDRIVGYKNGHIKRIILPKEKIKLTKEALIQNIIKYHPQIEPFELDDFMDITADEPVLSYVESCYRSGRINTVIKKYIKEGLL